MTSHDLPVGEGTRVFLNFSLSLDDGDVIDTNYGGEMVSFVVGDGSLLPGFERRLFGMCGGDRSVFQVEPEDAFGMPNPMNVQELNRSDFDDDLEISDGLVISFADASGAELPGVVREFDEQTVSVDFNHPLAGRRIHFDVEIHRVEAAELH
jgi:FKBP-type peptidyl-prolyl cis-trans isomerase SlpA